MRKLIVIACALFSIWQGNALAALRDEWVSEKEGGPKNAHIFYDKDKPVKSEVDKNNDGKPDLFMQFKNGKRHTGQESKKCDGKINRWYDYNDEGALLQRRTDTNGDEKPDEFVTFYDGLKEAVTKEYDLNFDGKIDKRVFQQWDAKKSLTVPMQNRMTRIPNPGYKILWKQEDTNFDGVIDAYRNRLDKKKNEVGQAMDPLPFPLERAQSARAPEENSRGPKKGQTESLVDRMNQKHGF